MADPLYDELKALDEGIAKAYRSASLGDPTYPITERGVNLFIDSAMRDKKFDVREGQALVKLLKQAKFAPSAFELFKVMLINRLNDGLLGKKQLKGAELDLVRRALRMAAVLNIQFVSPFTNVTYSPAHYQAVLNLIDKGGIKVFEIDVGQFPTVLNLNAGRYSHMENELTLFAGFSDKVRFSAAVHEATHAIQDWQNSTAIKQYTEADAYLAGAIVEFHLRVNPADYVPGSANEVALLEAKKLYESGPVGLTGKPVKEPLRRIASAFAKDPAHAREANQRLKDEKNRREPADLAQELYDMLQAGIIKEFGKNLKSKSVK